MTRPAPTVPGTQVIDTQGPPPSPGATYGTGGPLERQAEDDATWRAAWAAYLAGRA